MLAEIPRKPVFPEHMILKLLKQIERDVEEDVIPVSTGIYSQHKLIQKLQAIPKPLIVNYEDPIFYDLADTAKYPCKLTKCPLCFEDFGIKKNVAVQCYFCGVWNCDQCICLRKRYHPRAKESTSNRFSICHNCDDKFLSLQLHHPYVQSKTLLQQVMHRVRRQKDEVELECQKRQTDSSKIQESLTKNKFKISSLKKQQIDLKKQITRMQTDKQQQNLKLSVKEKYLQMLLRKKTKMEAEVQSVKLVSQSTYNSKEDSPRESRQQSRPQVVPNVLAQVTYADETETLQNRVVQVPMIDQKQQHDLSYMKQVTAVQKEQIQNQNNSLQQKSIEVVHEQEQRISKESFKSNLIQRTESIREVYTQQALDTEEHNYSKEQYSRMSDANDFSQLHQANQNQTGNITQQYTYNTRKREYLAELFDKKQQKLIQMPQDELSQHQSLNQQVIQARKQELVRSAIESSRRQRLIMEMPIIQKRTCQCLIY